MAKFVVVVVGQAGPVTVEADEYVLTERWLAFMQGATVVYQVSVPMIVSIRRDSEKSGS